MVKPQRKTIHLMTVLSRRDWRGTEAHIVSRSTVMPSGRMAASASRKMVRAGGIVSRLVLFTFTWLNSHHLNLIT